ncbi:MAG: thioredoxin family protein [Tannerella sp.]|nr:thioredoxin family protein [Tannerella sp.]
MDKKYLLFAGLFWITFVANAQIYKPVKWDVKLIDTDTAGTELRFTATAATGWHVYDMNLPKGGPVSTNISYERKQGFELIGAPVSSIAPEKEYDEMFKMEVRWYAGSFHFTQKINITDPARFRVSGELEFMACNDETCLPPDRIPFAFDRRHIRQTDSQVLAELTGTEIDSLSLDSLGSLHTGDSLTKLKQPASQIAPLQWARGISSENQATSDSRDLWTPVIEQLNSFGASAASATTSSWLYIFVAGFIGGLIALLTPCVWPMIPMTVSFFLKRSRERKKAVGDALIYGLSIIVIYLAMGLLITGIFGASALNSLSTNAIFNILFCLLLVLFAVSFFGAFELVLPASWTNRMDSKADATTGILSIFFMAFTLTLVSFSCTGPIIGTLLVEAASKGLAIGPAVGMFGFALALAIPFAFFSVFPNIMKNIPKSGGWLNSVKVVLGFLELALALKFLSVADLAYGWRILDREVFLVLWIVIFALLGFYLLGKIRFRYDSPQSHVAVPRLMMAIVSLAFAIYMIPGLWGAPLKAISAFTPPLFTQDFSLYDEVHAVFDDYEEGMAYAKRVNRPVMIDFSGYGCVNCRKMEATVWNDPTVKQLLEEQFVLITLMVDDKTRLPEPVQIEEDGKLRTLKTIGDKWSFLQRHKFGANAQPYYVILDHNADPLSAPYAYNEDIPRYIRFLESGLKRFNQ